MLCCHTLFLLSTFSFAVTSILVPKFLKEVWRRFLLCVKSLLINVRLNDIRITFVYALSDCNSIDSFIISNVSFTEYDFLAFELIIKVNILEKVMTDLIPVNDIAFVTTRSITFYS